MPISRLLLQKASEAGAGRVFASLNITLGAAVPARDASAVMHSSRKRKMALSCEDFQFYGNTLCSKRIDLRRAVKDADCSTAAPVDAGCAGIMGGGGSKGSRRISTGKSAGRRECACMGGLRRCGPSGQRRC